MAKNKIIFALGVIVLIIAGYWYYASRKAVPANPVNNPINNEESASTSPTAEFASSTPHTILGRVPSLDHQVIFASQFNATQKTTWQEAIASSKSALRADNANYDAWIDLANSAAAVGDTDYAIEILKFISLNVTASGLAECNLGTIYGYHLHDNTQAEIHFKAAVAREPNLTYCWIQAAQFFLDTKQPTKAKDILKQGIALKITDYQSLQALLNQI